MDLSILLGKLEEKIMLSFVEKYKYNRYSQQGEDGIISEILQRIGIDTPACAEFGAHDGKFCSNTFSLIEQKRTAKSVMIESSPELFNACRNNMSAYNVDVLHSMVTPDNINTLVLPYNPDLLSVDVDGIDFSLWKAYKGKPAIVVIEINSSFPPFANGPVNDIKNGTAYLPMLELGISKHYFLVAHTGNMIFVLSKYRHLFPEITGDGKENSEQYFSTQWL